MKLIRTLAVAFALASAPALAADLPSRVAPIAPYAATPVFTWDGFYVGAVGGYATGKQNLNSVNGYAVSGTADSKGATIGGTVGYNKSFGSIVTGVEGDLSWANFDGSKSFEGATVGAKTNAYGTLRGRVGYAMGSFLPYVTGGLYYQHGKGNVSYGVNSYESASDNAFGWTIGAGAEYALTNNWSVKGEYLYAKVNTNTYTFNTFGATADTDSHNHIFRTGVNYRF